MNEINLEAFRKFNPKLLLGLRITLGICLGIKGVQFIRDTTLLHTLLLQVSVSPSISWLEILIPWAHLLAGVLITVGLYTRLAAISQLPILLGAVFYVNIRQALPHGEVGELIFSVVVLVMLICLLFTGAGSISLDTELRNKDD